MPTAHERAPATWKDASLAEHLRSEPVLLAVPFVMAIFFLAVTGLSRLYQAQPLRLCKALNAKTHNTSVGPRGESCEANVGRT